MSRKDRICKVCGKPCYGHECEDCYRSSKYKCKVSRLNRNKKHKEKKVSFIYTVHGPCRGQTFVTEDTSFAEEASRAGLIVKCVGTMVGGKDEG